MKVLCYASSNPSVKQIAEPNSPVFWGQGCFIHGEWQEDDIANLCKELDVDVFSDAVIVGEWIPVEN